MNIHAHLFENEIIGYCGGVEFVHKSGKKAIYVNDAYNVDAINNVSYDRTKSVEMNPECCEQTVRLIDSRNQTVLAWYHSHPVFETSPSCMDIVNHHNHQMMYSKDNDQVYVGFIVGPYTRKLNS
jgi:protein MYSM1